MKGEIPDSRAAFELALVEMAHKWRRVVDNMLRPQGLSQATWRTLYFVGQAGGEIAQKELAFLIGIEGPSLVHLLDSLEQDRLIERRVSQSDRRAKTIHLTEDGQANMTRISEILDLVRQALLADIGDDDIAGSLELFDRIRSNAELFEEGSDG